MASFFVSPQFLSHPVTKTNNYFSSSQQTLIQQLSENTHPNVTGLRHVKPIGASKTSVDSTEWINFSLTRRYGIAAGLAWIGIFAVSKQIKTKLEVSQEEENTRYIDKEVEVILPNGIRYYELQVGDGASPRPGDLVVVNVKGSVQGSEEVFIDTFGGENKALALVIGSITRPYSKGICEGIENALTSINACGKRRVIIPSSLGFGQKGADLGQGVQIPPYATLEYVIEVDRVSTAHA